MIQRLFGLLLVVGSDQPLSVEERKRLDGELRAVLAELRGALERSLAPSEHETRTTLRHQLDRLDQRPELEVEWQDGVELPAELEPLLQSVLAGGVAQHRQARPADPGRDTRRRRARGVRARGDERRRREGNQEGGLGIRLMSMEAIQHRGIVEFGAVPPDRWRVRLVVPGPRR